MKFTFFLCHTTKYSWKISKSKERIITSTHIKNLQGKELHHEFLASLL